ncbi:MAG TPA: GNAT family N-acetyltransferase [Candidatus Limnocylindrales bacterium]|nr:GNAT family N-acetyltransferase [Candidatus Limnocylindrales bacterium]
MTGAGFEVRRLTVADVAVVVRAAALFDHSPRRPETRRFLASEDHHLLMAFVGSEPVGFVSGYELVHPDKAVEMFLYELSVAESARRRGVGRALVEALADVARERSCRGMWVLTDHDNEAAKATYRSAGATIDEPTLLLEWKL